MVESPRAPRGLVDTSVMIDLDLIDVEKLPHELVVSALTMAELAAGPHATGDPGERARRQDRLQRATAAFDPMPFDDESARAYGRVYAAVLATGRKARGPRAVDLLIAATALAADFPSTRATPMTSEASNTFSLSSASDPTFLHEATNVTVRIYVLSHV